MGGVFTVLIQQGLKTVRLRFGEISVPVVFRQLKLIDTGLAPPILHALL